MIEGKEILAPTTGTGGISETFDVDKHSRVVYIAPNSGESLTVDEDDTFELRRVIAEDPQRSLPVYEDDALITLGANRTQFEVVIRGTYVVKKTGATTENVGAYQTYGNEEGA